LISGTIGLSRADASLSNKIIDTLILAGPCGDGLKWETSPHQHPLDLLVHHRRNLLLEEQIQRELRAQALLASRLQSLASSASRGKADSSPPARDVGPGSGILGGGFGDAYRLRSILTSNPGPVATTQGFNIPTSPPLKKKQRPGDSTLPGLCWSIHKKERRTKFSFPVPSAQRRKLILVRDLSSLRKTWQTICDRSAAVRNEALKEAFNKELFARALVRDGGNSLALRLNDLS
jgi:hypothetical protein